MQAWGRGERIWGQSRLSLSSAPGPFSLLKPSSHNTSPKTGLHFTVNRILYHAMLRYSLLVSKIFVGDQILTSIFFSFLILKAIISSTCQMLPNRGGGSAFSLKNLPQRPPTPQPSGASHREPHHINQHNHTLSDKAPVKSTFLLGVRDLSPNPAQTHSALIAL